ncbi:MAG TPA: glutamine synthetase type III, partial [Bacteroidales bacterium]|nr:glutamine synthetase type III [Bacteroidales bacterium]
IEVPKIPEILLDNTDRNRTSPFAFTGNKFELRAVGSSANCAAPMIALNAAVAQALRTFLVLVESLQSSGVPRKEAILEVVRQFVHESVRIRFEGNCYSQEWVDEAKRRGLSNYTSSVEAFKAFISTPTLGLFDELGILSEREMKARYEIRLENYIRKVQIEARVMGDLATNHIIPIAIRYQNLLIENVRGLQAVLDQKTYVKLSKVQLQSIREISEHIMEIRVNVAAMVEARRKANRLTDAEEQAKVYDREVRSYFDRIRYHADKLELLVDDELWPLPKYRELLFTR